MSNLTKQNIRPKSDGESWLSGDSSGLTLVIRCIPFQLHPVLLPVHLLWVVVVVVVCTLPRILGCWMTWASTHACGSSVGRRRGSSPLSLLMETSGSSPTTSAPRSQSLSFILYSLFVLFCPTHWVHSRSFNLILSPSFSLNSLTSYFLICCSALLVQPTCTTCLII